MDHINFGTILCFNTVSNYLNGINFNTKTIVLKNGEMENIDADCK